VRPSLDDYFMTIAMAAARRSTCPRARVGCVLSVSNRLLSVGYNGQPSGVPHCTDVGCNIGGHGGCTAVHAEVNAIAWAARWGMGLEMARAYVTLSPCKACFIALRSAGVREIVFAERYRIDAHLDKDCRLLAYADVDHAR
jgi:dCMP deaminase